MTPLNDEHLALLDEIDKKIGNIQTRIAFWHLFIMGMENPQFHCLPNRKGVILEVRLAHKNDIESHRYSFIVNKQSLLWYFRRPALEKFGYELTDLEADFPVEKVKQPVPYEITVKIDNFQDARILSAKYLR